jgi:hypothetical protein
VTRPCPPSRGKTNGTGAPRIGDLLGDAARFRVSASATPVSGAEGTRTPDPHTARPFHHPFVTGPATRKARKHGPFRRWLTLTTTAVSQHSADFCGPTQDQLTQWQEQADAPLFIAPLAVPACTTRFTAIEHRNSQSPSRVTCASICSDGAAATRAYGSVRSSFTGHQPESSSKRKAPVADARRAGRGRRGRRGRLCRRLDLHPDMNDLRIADSIKVHD